MGFWTQIWRSRKVEDLRVAARWWEDLARRREQDIEALRSQLQECRTQVRKRDDLLMQISVAVGRVRTLSKHVTSGGPYAGLGDLVALVVTDHDDLEARIDAVVAYLRSFGPDEVPVTAAELRTQVGRLIQGADPEIVDLQGGIDIGGE